MNWRRLEKLDPSRLSVNFTVCKSKLIFTKHTLKTLLHVSAQVVLKGIERDVYTTEIIEAFGMALTKDEISK